MPPDRLRQAASPVPAHELQDSQLHRQCNEGKWEFSLQEDGDVVVLDVAVGRYLDSSLIRADVQPGLVRLLIKVCLLSFVLQNSFCCLRQSSPSAACGTWL